MDWQATELSNSWRHPSRGIVRKSTDHQEAAACAASVMNWNRPMQMLEDRLQRSGAHVVGLGFTLTDVCIGLAVQRWPGTPRALPLVTLPAVSASTAGGREGPAPAGSCRACKFARDRAACRSAIWPARSCNGKPRCSASAAKR